MVSRTEAYGWVAVMAVLVGLTIPWFLCGSGSVAFGLPLWLWWHIGWMGLASLTFYAFTRRAWGIGIEADESTGPGAETEAVSESRASTGGGR